MREFFLKFRWFTGGAVVGFCCCVALTYLGVLASGGLSLIGIELLPSSTLASMELAIRDLQIELTMRPARAQAPQAQPASKQQDPDYSPVGEYPVGLVYDDSWQFKSEPLDKDVGFGVVLRTWQCKRQALRHAQAIRVDAPVTNEQVRSTVERCLTTAAVVGVISGLATMDGTSGTNAFHAALAACATNEAFRLYVVDKTHWTAWENCS